ncbi:RNA methyltransferase [Candidatus Parcubacteria bacterium]|nr:RNA methyltransferase [Candidatus Parcubacteria bacterium]
MKTINSLQNPLIKETVKLRKASERRKQGEILVEGYKEIKLAQDNGLAALRLFYCDEYARGKYSPDTLLAKEMFLVSPDVFDKISYRDNPDGFLAVISRGENYLAEIKLTKDKPALIIVLESVEKPGNLGAILRTADAAQADAVIVCDAKTDIYNPNVIRSSLGTLFTVPVAIASNSEALSWLKDNEIKILAATPSAKDIYFDQDMAGALAIVVGTEHDGLSGFWLDNADKQIKLPMLGKIDSLNASVSAAILTYEALRQRFC